MLESTSNVQTGGYNYGVRSFTANATPTGLPLPTADLIPWSEDFSTVVPLNTSNSGLSAGDWYISGNGIANEVAGASITLNEVNDQVVLSTIDGGAGAVQLGAIGQGTNEPRRTAPVDHEAKYVFDLISFRNGQADLTVRSRGLDGYVQLNLSPGGRAKFSHWHSNFQHATFNTFNGPSQFRMANGVIITSGGTFGGTGGVTVVIGDPETADGVTATADVVMNAENTEVVSVTMTNAGSGYTDEPTVVFSGGGVSVQPEFTFTFETDNVTILAPGVTGDNGSSATNNKIEELGSTVFNDGSTLTLVQSYDSATDTITYYYGLNDDPVTNVIMTLDPAINSAGGYGFFNVVTGNRWGATENADAVYLRYQQWGTGTAQIGFNSYALEFTDKDGDGIINRLDWAPDTNVFPTNSSKETWLTANGYSTGGGAITQEAYDAVLAEKATAVAAQATAEAAQATAVAALAAAPTASEIQSTFLNARVGSVGVSVSGGEATISLQVEESDDAMTTWSAPAEGATSVTIPVSGDATFFRVRAQ